LQEFGYAKTRKNYLDKYKSRTTFYNYLKRLEKISNQIDLSSFYHLESFKIYKHFLKQFNIEPFFQQELNMGVQKNEHKTS